jgi:hypothetical protein
MPAATASLRALLAQLIDYAGLFPPAALSMADVAANYAGYRKSRDAWALGRVVVPVPRLDELSGVATPFVGPWEEPWRVSALAGEDAAHDADAIRRWNLRQGGRLVADAVEVRVSTVDEVRAVASALGDSMTVFVEIPVAEDPRALIGAIAEAGVRAKIRTGGVTAAAFPTAAQVARFIVRCAERDVPFKATAGLHHPLRGEFRLTYAPDAERGTMFGFLNAFLAAAFAHARQPLPEASLLQLLEERDPSAVRFSDDAVRWRNHTLSTSELLDARATFAIAFGSCSFREPIDDLLRLGLM